MNGAATKTHRLLAGRRALALLTSALLSALLNVGGVPRVEATPVDDFVTRFYSNVLDRSPDSAGKAAWVSLINANCNAQGFDSIARGFFDSEEFRTVKPLSLNGLVSKLYQTFLGRNPDAGGLGAWAALVRQARLNIALQGFVPSQEFQGLLPNRTNRTAVTTVVTRLYQQVLGRNPEQAGLQAWVDFIVTTGNLETAAQGFLASQEFESHPQTFRDYVTTLYRTFLNRDPEPAGLNAWEAILRDTLLQIINAGFVPSAEFQGQISTLCGTGPIPDLRGIYQGTLTETFTNCLISSENVTAAGTLTVNINSQTGGAFSGTALVVGGLNASFTTFSGTVNAFGPIAGSFTYGGAGFSGNGTFTGTAFSRTLAGTVASQDTAGDTCRGTGTFVVSR